MFGEQIDELKEISDKAFPGVSEWRRDTLLVKPAPMTSTPVDQPTEPIAQSKAVRAKAHARESWIAKGEKIASPAVTGPLWFFFISLAGLVIALDILNHRGLTDEYRQRFEGLFVVYVLVLGIMLSAFWFKSDHLRDE